MTITAALLVFGVALAGCTGDGEDPASPQPPSAPVASVSSSAAGEVLVIEPVRNIPGATRVEVVDGVSIVVPNTWTAELNVNAERTALFIKAPGEEVQVAAVTVSSDLGRVGDVEAEAATMALIASLRMSDIADEIRKVQIHWSGLPSGWGVVSVMAHPEDGVVRDGLAVTLPDSARSRLVSVSAQAPQGMLEDSLQRQVVATLRIE